MRLKFCRKRNCSGISSTISKSLIRNFFKNSVLNSTCTVHICKEQHFVSGTSRALLLRLWYRNLQVVHTKGNISLQIKSTESSSQSNACPEAWMVACPPTGPGGVYNPPCSGFICGGGYLNPRCCFPVRKNGEYVNIKC